MANSISSTSNIPTATNATLATFKAGDAILCPSFSITSFLLMTHLYGKEGS